MKREPAKSFQDLIVWQKAHQFVLSIYRLSDTFPKNELYGLTSQTRRAAVSIAANIAEGFKKKTKPDKANYLNIAQGSLEECRYYLILAKDLGYGDTAQLMSELEEVSKLLQGYMSSLLSVSCLLPPIPEFCLLSTDFCLLSSVSYLLTPISCILSPASYP